MAARPLYPWEGWPDADPVAEGPGDDEVGGWGEDCIDRAATRDYDDIGADEAQQEFFDLLVDLKLKGAMTAKQVCLIAFWATHSGAKGPITRLAVKPSAQTGKFSHKFDSVVGKLPDDCHLYDLPLARRVRHSAVRLWEPISVRLPLDALVDQMAKSAASLEAKLDEAKRDGNLPPCFVRNPHVQAAGPEGRVFQLRSISMVLRTRGPTLALASGYTSASVKSGTCWLSFGDRSSAAAAAGAGALYNHYGRVSLGALSTYCWAFTPPRGMMDLTSCLLKRGGVTWQGHLWASRC